MGNQSPSRFSDHQEWTILSKKSCKEILQSKKTKQIVEKYVLEHLDPQEFKRESLIYEWRNSKKTSRFTVQIQEMQYLREEEATCMATLCKKREEENCRLIIYAEQMHKLYQNNSKYTFDEPQQVQLFAQIFEAIESLSAKFGYFMITKQMIGYNSKMVGKAWINENFASNFVQFKRQVQNKSERQKWESSIIDNVIDICRLCTTEINEKTNKFSYVIAQIRKHRLLNFGMFSAFNKKINGVEVKKSEQKGKRNSEEKSHQVASNEFSNSKGQNGRNSSGKEVIASTKEFKNSTGLKEKKFVMVPVVNIKKIYHVSEEERRMINNHFRNSEHLSSNIRPNSMILQTSLRQNYVDVQRNCYSYIKSKDQDRHKIQSEIHKPPLDSIIEQPHLSPKEYNQGSSNKSQHDKSRQRILMVDSMILIENEYQAQHQPNKHTNVILEESIILRGNQK